MNRFAVVLMVAASLCGSLAWAQDWYGPVDPHLAEVETDHEVRADFVTPHTDWGSPWAPGKAHVLFFVNGRGTAAREVTELMQRFDFEPQMVFWARLIDSTVDAWHGGEEGLQRIDRLLGEKWDAFVFLGIPVEKLSSEQQFRLLEQVANGAGLVLSGVDDKRVLKPSNQLKPLPTMLAAGASGRGLQAAPGAGAAPAGTAEDRLCTGLGSRLRLLGAAAWARDSVGGGQGVAGAVDTGAAGARGAAVELAEPGGYGEVEGSGELQGLGIADPIAA